MRRKRHNVKHLSFFKKMTKNPFVMKVTGYIIVAFLSYVLNHLQTAGHISKLEVDNKDLIWAVDYFRQ